MTASRCLCLLLLGAGVLSCSFNSSGIGPQDSRPAVTPDRHLADLVADRPAPPPADLGHDLTVTPLPDFFVGDGLPDVPITCTTGWFKCGTSATGDESLRCNPKDGTYKKDRACPLGCDVPSGRCNSFVPSSKAGDLVKYGSEAVVIDKVEVVLDTSSGTVSAKPPFDPAKSFFCPAGYPACYLTVAKLDIKGSGKLRAAGARPLVIVAVDSISIDGTIDVSAAGSTPGAGGLAGGAKGSNAPGQGGGLGTPLNTNPTVRQVGASGGSFGGQGGRGGPNGLLPPGASDDLCLTQPTTIVGGRGGGGGSAVIGGDGGAGGGGLQLTALGMIDISGTIVAGGGGGGGGTQGVLYSGSGGGGGSGGGILVEAPAATISGTLAANGGAGGAGSLMLIGSGGNGENGKPSAVAAKGGDGPDDGFLGDEGGNGGEGSAGSKYTGGDGVAGKGTGADGAGGGGAGSVCLRTATGTVPGNPKLSPAFSTVHNAVKYRKLPPTTP